jgi:DNA-binding IclR family transcriptional regulator
MMTQSLERGLEILRAFTEQHPQRTAAEISAATTLPISTVYRLLHTLEQCGFVEPCGNARYQLGVSVHHLAQVVRQQLPTSLAAAALPILRDLTARTGETSILTGIIGQHAICIERVESQQAVRLSFQRGRIMPLWAGASARVLLAYADPALIEQVLGSSVAQRRSVAVLPDYTAMQQELAQIRARGYADSIGEVDAGARAIAVPVFTADQRLLAGVSVAAPCERIRDTHVPLLLEWLYGAAAQIQAAARFMDYENILN